MNNIIEQRLKSKVFRNADRRERMMKAKRKALREWTLIGVICLILLCIWIVSGISTYCYANGIWDINNVIFI